ncbi:protein PLASTID REDOX INSENSITIVE 2, chloroplastic isoform X1 [Syzygium oleosum]|uniref:protein PLASTID REDOX INSENSITIVE 2, chloroplastic isoform X1 n=1 Tax=Syzygium oleosum TaxID=219896 RepID=UPI0011D25EDA|nr:protein PLASTID REDOX INSENSITIVE 2, chloroplastic isoform X1 [Syzygium oleosum]
MMLLWTVVSPPPLSQFPFSLSSSSSTLRSPLPPPPPPPPSSRVFSSSSSHARSTSERRARSSPSFSHLASKLHHASHICRAAEYKFPDPIPEFADAETEKFRTHLLTKLSKKDLFGDSIDEVVGICTEIFSTFLHSEYGGPGTLLVIPFIDMADTINERGLPGGPQAARAAVKWAQGHVDKDWNEWNGEDSS